MLATAFPPLPFFRTPAFDEMFEALCLSALAAYPFNTVTERSIEAFKRAWGMQELNWQAADANGTPGYVVAQWTNTFTGVGVSRKVLVAINGITDLAGAGIFDGLPTDFSNLPGRVKARWATNAQTVEATLLPNYDLLTAAQQSRTQISLAGWSAGANTAELLAYRFNQQYQFPAIKLFKFGGAQTGDRVWYRRRDPRVQRQNLVVREDPICAVPGGGTNTNIFGVVANNTINTCNDPDVWHFSEFGENVGGYRGLQTSFPGTLIMQYLNQGLINNFPWNSHDRRIYMYACAAYCQGIYPSLFMRILHSELPDANNLWARFPQWNSRNQTLVNFLPTLFELADPAPADVDMSPAAREELGLLPPPRPIVTQTTVREDPDNTAVGGDWGQPAPAPFRTVTNSVPLRRRLRVRR